MGFQGGILPRRFAVSAENSPIGGALIDTCFGLALDLGRLLLSLVRSVADGAVNQKHAFSGGYQFRIKERSFHVRTGIIVRTA